MGTVGVAVNAPPSILYCTVNPDTAVTVGSVNAALHVFAGTANIGAEGNTTKFFVSLHATPGVVYVAVKHPAVLGVNTPVLELIVPPPLTVQVPFAAPPDCAKVTVPPPIHALEVVTTGTALNVAVTVPLTFAGQEGEVGY